MEENHIKLLLIEDNPGDARLIREALREAGGESFDLQHADRLATGLARLAEGDIHLVLLDLSLPDSHGLDTVARTHARAPDVPIVVLTGLDDEALALKALEIGAQDYLVKGDVDGRVLNRAIRYAIERQRAEQALRQSEARFRGLLEFAPDAVLIVNREGRITFANAQAEKMFGYQPDELLDQWIEMLVPDRFRGRHGQHRFGFMAAPRARPMDSGRELQGQRKDGSEFDADIMLGPLEMGGELSVLCIVRDVSERKAAEAALAAKAEEIKAMTQQLWQAAKLATMGELAASIAHELNNPLGTVSLRVESLLSQMPPGDPGRRELEVVEQEVERMGALVAHLLHFSRRGAPQISTVDVREEIENTLELIHYHLRQRQITVQREFAPEVPMVPADRQQLRQLFLNLFTNAGDAMPQGGTLTIRVYVQKAESGRQKAEDVLALPSADRLLPSVCIEVADTGTGIAPEDLPKVTEPFFTTKPEGKGTGLGLAICRRIVQEHNGTFEISSAGTGQGTTVRLTLPPKNNSHEAFLQEEA